MNHTGGDHVSESGKAQPPKIKISSRLGFTVICAGGCMDAFSYLLHGEVFATGQTGNIVRLCMGISNGDIEQLWRYSLPITSFFLGVFLSRLALDFIFHRDEFRAQRFITIFEAIAFTFIGLMPQGVSDQPVNCLISFCAALAFENFRRFGTKSNYSSMFCTGNLRSLAETLYDGTVRGNAHELHRTMRYAGLIFSFGVGVAVCSVLIAHVGRFAAFLISALFLCANAFIPRRTDLNQVDIA